MTAQNNTTATAGSANLRPSHWLDGCCFKCTHYRLPHCQKHGIDITGDANHRCDDYELSTDRWHNEVTQKWEYEAGVKALERLTRGSQTSLARWM